MLLTYRALYQMLWIASTLHAAGYAAGYQAWEVVALRILTVG